MSTEIKKSCPCPHPSGSWWQHTESILDSAKEESKAIKEGLLGRDLITASATHNCTQLLKVLNTLNWDKLTAKQLRRAKGYKNFASKVKHRRAVVAQ